MNRTMAVSSLYNILSNTTAFVYLVNSNHTCIWVMKLDQIYSLVVFYITFCLFSHFQNRNCIVISISVLLKSIFRHWCCFIIVKKYYIDIECMAILKYYNKILFSWRFTRGLIESPTNHYYYITLSFIHLPFWNWIRNKYNFKWKVNATILVIGKRFIVLQARLWSKCQLNNYHLTNLLLFTYLEILSNIFTTTTSIHFDDIII